MLKAEGDITEIKEAYRLHFLEFLEMLRNLEVGAAAQEKIFFFATRLRAIIWEKWRLFCAQEPIF